MLICARQKVKPKKSISGSLVEHLITTATHMLGHEVQKLVFFLLPPPPALSCRNNSRHGSSRNQAEKRDSFETAQQPDGKLTMKGCCCVVREMRRWKQEIMSEQAWGRWHDSIRDEPQPYSCKSKVFLPELVLTLQFLVVSDLHLNDFSAREECLHYTARYCTLLWFV